MHKIIFLQIGCLVIFALPSIGQQRDTTFINSKGDTIHQIFDSQHRLLEEYINRFIHKKIKYDRVDTIKVDQQIIHLSKLKKLRLTYPVKRKDTLLWEITYLKKRRIWLRSCLHTGWIYWLNVTSGSKLVVDILDCVKKVFLKNVYVLNKQKKQGIPNNYIYKPLPHGNAYKIPLFIWKQAIQSDGFFDLKSKLIKILPYKKEYGLLQVNRIVPDKPQVTYYTRDTFIRFDTIPFIEYDTTLVPILDKNIYLPPLRNFENTSSSIETIPIPLSNNHTTYLAYWIGVGTEAKQAYADLEVSLSNAEVAKEIKVNKPLGLFALGKLELPNSTNPYVKYLFNNSTGRFLRFMDDEMTNTEFNQLSNNYAQKKMPVYQSPQYLFMTNQNPINGHSIAIKIIAIQIATIRKNKIVIRKVIGPPYIVK